MTVLKMPEFIEMAVRDEETGEAFYTELAKSAPTDDMRGAFAKMAGQERAHAERFRKMKTELGDYKPTERHEGEYEGYFHSLLEMRAFGTPAEAAAKAKALKDPREAVEIAMRMEKDTLLFYMELLEFLPESQGRFVHEIVGEEQMHVNQLTALSHRLTN
ncbi:MAG TPA: ferritin family protein [bacterium]|nr:ferritin family protein [bacterium]